MTAWLTNNYRKLFAATALTLVASFLFSNVSLAQTSSRPDGVPSDTEYNEDSGLWCRPVSFSSSDGILVSSGGECYGANGQVVSGQTSSKVESSNPDVGSGLIGWVASSALEEITWWVVYLIGYLAGVVFALGGLLIEFALEINSQLLNMEIIHTGWSVTRDIANLGFVLGILVIAFSTIIDRQTYGMRSLLVKLITMAVLINFSLVFSGIILDFAGIMTVFFANGAINPGDGSWHEFSARLAGITQVDALKNIDPNSAGLASQLGSSFMVSISSLIFIVFFTVFAAIIFLGIAIMFIARFINLAILLILAPLAWFSGIFPGRINQSGLWWSKFLNWTFFAPVSMFFLFLAVNSLSIADGTGFGTLNNAQQNLTNNLAQANSTFDGATIFAQTFGQIGTMIVVLGFMLGSLIVGQRMGIAVASVAMGWANRFQGWAIGKARNISARAGQAAGGAAVRTLTQRTGLDKKVEEWQEQAQKGELEGFGGRLRSLASRAILPLQKSSTRDILEKSKKEISNLDTDQAALQYLSATPSKKAAIIEYMAEKKALHKLPGQVDKDLYKRYGGDMKKLGNANILYSEDKKDEKNVAKQMENTLGKTGDELTEAVKGLTKALDEKLASMNPADVANGQWLKMVNDGIGSGMSKEEWQGSAQQQALVGSMATNWQGKEFGKAFGDASLSDRQAMANRLLATNAGISNEDLARRYGVTTDKLSDKLKEVDLSSDLTLAEVNNIKRANESLYNYITKFMNSISSDDAGTSAGRGGGGGQNNPPAGAPAPNPNA